VRCRIDEGDRELGSSAVILRGYAVDADETFAFTIEPFVTGGFTPYISFSGDGRKNTTGAGIWPTIEKAKEIAQATATRLLHGAIIAWDNSN
jgi:hypothetical protein